MKERYYSESLLRSLAYDDDVNGNCDGMIDFTVVDSIGGADVAPVVHGEWSVVWVDQGHIDMEKMYKCSVCGSRKYNDYRYCPNCGARMDGGKE